MKRIERVVLELMKKSSGDDFQIGRAASRELSDRLESYIVDELMPDVCDVAKSEGRSRISDKDVITVLGRMGHHI